MCSNSKTSRNNTCTITWVLVSIFITPGNTNDIYGSDIIDHSANAVLMSKNNTIGGEQTSGPESAGTLGRYMKGNVNVKDSTGKCNLSLSQRSINRFRHIIYYSDSSYAYLRLKPAPGSNVSFVETSDVVGETIWVWTFYGKDGSLEFLRWPIEFGIWSLGLLYTSTTLGPLDMELTDVSGNCSGLHVGDDNDNYVISNALEAIVVEMKSLNRKYEPSFFCFKNRMFIQSNFTYNLCKHIVCPIENIRYNCCSYLYNKTIDGRQMTCDHRQKTFEYDGVWWIFPVIVSFFLFSYSPVLLAFIGYRLSDADGKAVEIITYTNPRNASLESVLENDEDEQNVTIKLIHRQDDLEKHEILMSGFDHVTFLQTFAFPLQACIRACANDSIKSRYKCINVLSRLSRAIFPILSLSVIGIQVILDYKFLHGFVLEAMNKGVPMGFRSMLAGVDNCRCNFLPLLGGPFVAVGCYLFVTILLLVIPSSVIKLVTSGLDAKSSAPEPSPLCLNLKTVGILSSVRMVKQSGYCLLYHWYLAQLYMLLNVRFWIRCLEIQVGRWRSFTVGTKSWLLLPFYVVICFFELLLSVLLYALPIFSFARIIINSYIKPVFGGPNGRSLFSKVAFLFVWIILVAIVAFFLFMFGTIFLDATLFISRIFMFTFTGIVVYPKTAYGYLIFGFTVFYYLWDSVGDFSKVYRQLFKDTLQAAESVQPANESNQQRLVFKINGEKGIRKSLFEFVIEIHRPRRKEVFLSLLRGTVVITFLAVLIHLLITTDKFRELHVIMHVGTALFICALPQIAKTVCRRKEDKRHVRRHRKLLQETVRQYMGYFVEEELSSTVESD